MLKLGVIEVLNTLPIHYAILEGLVPLPCELIHGRVTLLNEKLNQGLLDLSVVSSFEYARNPELYRILPSLSVSSAGPVKSIYLFSQVPIEQLAGETIQLTAFSLTSVHLVQFLLKDLQPNYVQGESPQAKATLLIADEAIQRYYSHEDAYVYDLGDLWWKKMGVPFAFALWVVREEVWQAEPESVRQAHLALLESKAMSESLLDEMAASHYRGIFPDQASCLAYLKNLHYDFTVPYQRGFEQFMAEMVKLTKLKQIAPLRFID